MSLPAQDTPMLLGGAGVAVLAILLGTRILLRQMARATQLAQRLAEGVVALAPTRLQDSESARRKAARNLAVWQARLTGLFGADLQRLDAYPLRWPLLVLASLVPAGALLRLAGHVVGFNLDLLLPLAWLLASRFLFGSLHTRYAGKLYRQFPDALAMIVRSVRAGVPLPESLRMVARESLQPTARQFSLVADQLAIGLRLEDALRDAAARTGVPEYAFFTVALSLQSQTGGSLAETLENLADVIRKRVGLRNRAVALASEARASAYVLGALPILCGIALTLLEYDYIKPLFEERAGNRILYGAIFLLLTGSGVMRTMIRSSLR